MSRDANPVPTMAMRVGRLGEPARRVHQAVQAAFITTGQPPSAGDLDRLTGSSGGDTALVRAITVTVDGDLARWAPRTAVVFAGDAGDRGGPSADRCCGYISFFTTGRAARAWARGHPEITGTVLRSGGALRIGIATFGALLQPAGVNAAGTGR